MSITLSNPATFQYINNLTRLGAQLELSNQRLSTGRRIVSAADDPAGLIAATRFAAEMAGIDSQLANAQRLNAVIDTADGALSQISDLLAGIRGDIIAAADDTTSEAERAAYQQKIDLAVDAVSRLTSTTSFNGQRLLDGSLAYTTSGLDTGDIANLRIRSANTAAGAVSLTIDTTSATPASIQFDGATLAADLEMTITGPDGSAVINLSAGADKSAIDSAVNAVSGQTGVYSDYDGGAEPLYLKTLTFGADQTITLDVTEGSFPTAGGVTSAAGADAAVTVNGQSVAGTDGQYYYSQNGAMISFALTDTFAGSGGSTTFAITGGGASWQLGASAWGPVNYGLDSLAPANLGTAALGYLTSLKSGGANALGTGNYSAAEDIADYAVNLVATERARLGAVKNYAVGSTVNSLTASQEALATEYSRLMDIDYAVETANNSRLQMLMEISTSLIAAMTQSAGNSVMMLLGYNTARS